MARAGQTREISERRAVEMVQNLALMVAGAQTGEGMSRLIGISTTALLFTLGLLHVYWAAGGKWGTDVTIPKQDGKPLFQPPPAGTLLVALFLLSAGLVVLGRLRLWGAALPRWVFVAGGVDSRGRLPRSGRGRLQVVWRLQADAGDSLRLVGHMALRSTLSSSGPRMPGGGGPE